MDRELFNFNDEVEPLLEVIVSKVIRVAEVELLEEKHLNEKEEKKEEY